MNAGPDADHRSNRRFAWAVLGLTLAAWLLREYFVIVTVVDTPIRGDVREYLSYALNMLQHGVFSHMGPWNDAPVPDAYRGPGYPAFLAACIWLDPVRWYALALHAQAAIGALTVGATTLLARHWLRPGWALAAGALACVWPHHVAATINLLSEVVFGFLLALALLLSAIAMRRRKPFLPALASGAVFSLAAMTNLVSLPFALFMALVYWRERLPRAGLALVVFALLGPGLWSLRQVPAQSPAEPGRVGMNLVQGAWPEYHAAYMSRQDPAAHAIMDAIESEERLFATDPAAGLDHVARCLAKTPARSIAWYLLRKPYLLWDWDIRIGAGDVYFHPPIHSPLETNGVLHFVKRSLQLLNPLVFALSAIASVVLLAGWLARAPWAHPAAVSVAGFCVFVTAVHVVFQAEPRYAVAYRPLQMAMLATALSAMACAIRSRWATRTKQPHRQI